jgi:Ca2+-binding RTX toxin-like protein
MAVVTVPGALGQTVTLNYESQANADMARQLAAKIAAGVDASAVVPVAQGSGLPPALPAGTTGEFVQTQNGLTALPSGYADVVNTARNAVIFGSGDEGEAILSGDGRLTFVATGGSGTVLGDGAEAIVIPAFDGGDWSINTGASDDRVLAWGGGNDTISAGGGHNEITLGPGRDVVRSEGDDTVAAGAGAETVDATRAYHDLVYEGSSNLLFVGGQGRAEVFGGTGSDTVLGGTGDTVVHGGTGGHNLLLAGYGQATLFGGGDGDQLYAEGSKAQSLYAGSGNETLSGAFARGDLTIHAGSGADQITLGGGGSQVIAGTGGATISGGTGHDVFTFIHGEAGGSSLIANFTSLDKIKLVGYGPDAERQALQSQVVANGAVSVTLSDNTTITVLGVSRRTSANFGARG